MRANLRTRCGCTRTIEIPFPPQRELVVPLVPDFKPFYKETDLFPAVQTRRFELRGFENRGPLHSIADYLEVL